MATKKYESTSAAKKKADAQSADILKKMGFNASKPKSRSADHDNSFITKLYRPVDRYVKNLVKEVSDVPKEYRRDLGLTLEYKSAGPGRRAQIKRQQAMQEGRPNQVQEALGAIIGRSPKKKVK